MVDNTKKEQSEQENLFSYNSGEELNAILTEMVAEMKELAMTYQDYGSGAFGKLCEIGKMLLEIKGKLSHGQFEDFYRENVECYFPFHFARRCIRFQRKREVLEPKFQWSIKRYSLTRTLNRLDKIKGLEPKSKSEKLKTRRKPQSTQNIERIPKSEPPKEPVKNKDSQGKIYLVKRVTTNRGYKERGDDNNYSAKHEHTSFEEALTEARRLSSLYSGCFMVFESVYYIESVEVKQEGSFS